MSKPLEFFIAEEKSFVNPGDDRLVICYDFNHADTYWSHPNFDKYSYNVIEVIEKSAYDKLVVLVNHILYLGHLTPGGSTEGLAKQLLTDMGELDE